MASIISINNHNLNILPFLNEHSYWTRQCVSQIPKGSDPWWPKLSMHIKQKVKKAKQQLWSISLGYKTMCIWCSPAVKPMARIRMCWPIKSNNLERGNCVRLFDFRLKGGVGHNLSKGNCVLLILNEQESWQASGRLFNTH